jgi:uncharacterized damage-inducible protein DinB
MPVAPEIICAVGGFRLNAGWLEKSIADLTPDEWKACPCESANSVYWILGHLVWSRAFALGLLGKPWSRPWLPLFGRGAKPADAGVYPSAEEVVEAWREVKPALDAALESITSEALAAAWTEKAPSFDGRLSGFIGFMATHESYHVGQLAYLRRWLGRDAVAG